MVEWGLADIGPRIMILHVAGSNSDLLESVVWLTLDPGSGSCYCMLQVPADLLESVVWLILDPGS